MIKFGTPSLKGKRDEHDITSAAKIDRIRKGHIWWDIIVFQGDTGDKGDRGSEVPW
jgi:hypothetical protein